MSNARRKFDSLGILLLVSASIPLLIGSFSLGRTIWFLSGAQSVEATVVAIRSKKPWPGKAVSRYPVVSFQDQAGMPREEELRSYSFPETLTHGNRVRLLVNEKWHGEVLIDSWRGRWAQPVLGLTFGLLLLGAAFFIGRKGGTNT